MGLNIEHHSLKRRLKYTRVSDLRLTSNEAETPALLYAHPVDPSSLDTPEQLLRSQQGTPVYEQARVAIAAREGEGVATRFRIDSMGLLWYTKGGTNRLYLPTQAHMGQPMID